MADLVALAIIVLAVLGWLASLWLWPYAPCRKCGGEGTSAGSNRKRFNMCRKCRGSRRRERFAARYVNRTVRENRNKRKK